MKKYMDWKVDNVGKIVNIKTDEIFCIVDHYMFQRSISPEIAQKIVNLLNGNDSCAHCKKCAPTKDSNKNFEPFIC